MRQNQVYGLFAVLFLIPMIALFTGQLILFVAAVVISVVIGAVADRVDNKLSEPYKKYNVNHHHHHSNHGHTA
jgi:hypothetical protein